MRSWSSTIGAMLVAATIGGCATADTTGSSQGQAGPFAWEISHVRQTRQESGREATWWYTLVLRNTSASVVALQRVVIGTIGLSGESWGGQDSQPFVRRVKAGDEIRLENQTFTYRCGGCDPGYVESALRRGVVRLLRFEGEDDQGRPLQALVRIRLDSGTGPILK